MMIMMIFFYYIYFRYQAQFREVQDTLEQCLKENERQTDMTSEVYIVFVFVFG